LSIINSAGVDPFSFAFSDLSQHVD